MYVSYFPRLTGGGGGGGGGGDYDDDDDDDDDASDSEYSQTLGSHEHGN